MDKSKKEMNRTSPLMLEEAVDILADLTKRISDTETVDIKESAGRTLAEDIRAVYDQPPFPRSPLDGYAVRAADTAGASAERPALLKVISEVDAGGYFDGTLEPGEAVRIMTGAPIPAGADAIVRQEDTDCGEETVRVFYEFRPHQNYCDQGEDYKAGTLLLAEHEYIGPVETGIIASTGRRTVSVYRRPKVLLISTGDEVIMPGEQLSAGKIYDSNLFTIAAQLTAWGIEVTETLHSGDDPGELVRMIEDKAEAADMIITTGGVSVGKKDILHDVFRILNIEKTFWKIGIKPGMAMLSGRYKGKHLLALSGNPYAAYVDLHLVVRPVLSVMTGNDHLKTQHMEAVLMDDYTRKSPTRRFVRALVRDGKAYIEGHTGGNGVILSGHNTNALLDIPSGTDALKAGEKVSVILLQTAAKSQSYSAVNRCKKEDQMPKIIDICGIKNSGKTTLISKLTDYYSSRGLKVAVIKHDGHDFECDIAGTDTYKFTKSGAYGVACFSKERSFVHKQLPCENVKELLDLFPEADIVFLEGLKNSSLEKIEVIRSGISETPVSNPDGRFLIVTDLPADRFDEETAGLNDLDKITAVIGRIDGLQDDAN